MCCKGVRTLLRPPSVATRYATQVYERRFGSYPCKGPSALEEDP